MKLRRICIENVRSFLDPTTLVLDGEITIVIGPNGGGKTNLLDTAAYILRRHLLTSWLPVRSPTEEDPGRFEFRANDTVTAHSLEKHSQGSGRDQVVELEIEVTPSDIANVNAIKVSAAALSAGEERRYTGVSLRGAADWEPALLSPGQRLTYRIRNNALDATPDPATLLFREYMAQFDAHNRVRSELKIAPLSVPMLSLPVNRAAGAFTASLVLASYEDSDFKKAVDAATSRSNGSIVSLALGRLAGVYRTLLEEDSGQARKRFYADPQVQSLGNVLRSLGYGWSLECRDPRTNTYDVRIEKQGHSFLVNAASSGEKELLTYLFAIYALNVRDALVVIDEPELHLHPRWQSTLLSLFETLAANTGNQFLLATHSPVFVSPTSIQYVSRVYSREQRSAIVRMSAESLPAAKHLASIVNSQKNERIFFADKVVLVEGISDRLFLESVFKHLKAFENSTTVCEVVDVGGKGFFSTYQQLLRSSEVPHMIVADLDYLLDVGSDEVKNLFAVDEKAITADVVANPGSRDGAALTAQLEAAIASGDMAELRGLWEYIKGRRRRLRDDLNTADRAVLLKGIEALRSSNIHVLGKGDLESYLPGGDRTAKVESLITFLATDFWPALADDARSELETIVKAAQAL